VRYFDIQVLTYFDVYRMMFLLLHSMATIPQNEKLLQAKVSEAAYRRIKVAAAMTDRAPGDVVTELAERYLPPVEVQDAAL